MGDFIPENCFRVETTNTYTEYDTGYDLGIDAGYDSDDVLEKLYHHLEDNDNQEELIEKLIEKEQYKKIESSGDEEKDVEVEVEVEEQGQKKKEQEKEDKKILYNIPKETSKDARAIWKKANIPDISDIDEIQYKLILWAVDNAEITVNEDDTIKTINWNISGNSKCKATWVAFIHWIICACVT